MSSTSGHRLCTKRGNTIVWLARPNTLPAADPLGGNWQCRAGIFAQDGSAVVATKDITATHTHSDATYFLVVFDETETTGLEPGDYVIAIDIANDQVSPPYSQETPIALKIDAELIPTNSE